MLGIVNWVNLVSSTEMIRCFARCCSLTLVGQRIQIQKTSSIHCVSSFVISKQQNHLQWEMPPLLPSPVQAVAGEDCF